MWERMFDLVLGLKKEHRLMIVITLIYAVTLFGITVDVEAMENWLQLVGYTIRTLCIACIIQLSVFFLTNIFWKELNRGLNKTFVVISGNVLSLAFLLFPFSISYIDMTAESMKLSSLNTERNRIDSMVRYYENLKSLDSSFSENLDSLILEEKKTLIRVIKEIDLKQFKIEEKQKRAGNTKERVRRERHAEQIPRKATGNGTDHSGTAGTAGASAAKDRPEHRLLIHPQAVRAAV